MKPRLIEIIDELRNVIKQQEINISDDVLFREACSFMRGELAQLSKEKNISNYKLNESKKENQKPTDKQVRFLEKFDVKIPETRKEATEMIKIYIENQKGEKK